MDRKLEKYSQLLVQIFDEYAEILNRRPQPDREIELVIDPLDISTHCTPSAGKVRSASGIRRYMLRLRNGKIFVEIDWMEDGIVDRLLEAGVSKDDIVLAFHHPDLRPRTEFPVA